MPAAHKPTEETRKIVSMHATVGTTRETIASILGIDLKTLRKHYRAELDEALAKANATVAGCLYQKAIGGDTTAMIFWLKTRARWREVERPDDQLAQPISVTFREVK